MRVEVTRTAVLRYPLGFVAKLGYDTNQIVETFKLFRAIATHLYWCKKLGIEPDPNVVAKAQQLHSYFRDCIFNERSQRYLFKNIDEIPRPRKTLLDLNPRVGVVIYPKMNNCVVLNLDRSEIWVYGLNRGTSIRLLLRKKTVEWIKKILVENPRKMATLVLRDDVLEIHLHFSKSVEVPDIELPLPCGKYVIAVVDINSRYGVVCTWMFIDIDRGVCRVIRFKKYRRRNLSKLWSYVSYIQRLRDRLRNIGALDYRKKLLYNKLVSQCLKKISAINRDFVAKTTNEIVCRTRRLAKRYGAQPLIVVDKPDPESLKGSALQQTLLRLTKILRVKVLWYGVPYIECRLASTVCPFCNEKMKVVRKTKRSRIYRCPRCGFEADRDLVPAYSFLMHYSTLKVGYPQRDHQHKVSIHRD